ncbi:MAG: hypothetical protein U0457_09430 [Candidatus Sericytochromatia bacterium]
MSLFFNTLIVCFGIFIFILTLITSTFLTLYMIRKRANKQPIKNKNIRFLGEFLHNSDENLINLTLECLKDLDDKKVIDVNGKIYFNKNGFICEEVEILDQSFDVKVNFKKFLEDIKAEYDNGYENTKEKFNIKTVLNQIHLYKIEKLYMKSN